MQDRYMFPAIFNYADDGISIKFPDLRGCLSCADNTLEAVLMARDALEGWLYICERDNEIIPEPSDIMTLKNTLKTNQIIVPIDVYMPPVRASYDDKPVNKMCTLPQWLVSASKDAGLNFSQTLQDALKSKLGIKREIKRRKYKR